MSAVSSSPNDLLIKADYEYFTTVKSNNKTTHELDILREYLEILRYTIGDISYKIEQSYHTRYSRDIESLEMKLNEVIAAEVDVSNIIADALARLEKTYIFSVYVCI